MKFNDEMTLAVLPGFGTTDRMALRMIEGKCYEFKFIITINLC